jgi:hypothetical protein
MGKTTILRVSGLHQEMRSIFQEVDMLMAPCKYGQFT